jgi:hypothetical protein
MHGGPLRRTLGRLLISIGRRWHPMPAQLEPAREPAFDLGRGEDRYTSWQAAAMLCADALLSWRESGPEDRPTAHAVYRAALDREEAAARELARSARRRE